MPGNDDTRLFLQLWTAAHRGERLVARELEADGKAGPQLAMLLLVGLHEPATTTALAAALGVSFMTASDALQRLAASGDVESGPNPADRRSQLYRLTTAGKARVHAVEAPLRRALGALGEEADVASLSTAVAELDAALARTLE